MMTVNDYTNKPANLNKTQVSEIKNLWLMCGSPIFVSIDARFKIRHFCGELFIMKEGDNFGFVRKESINPYRQVKPEREK